jgi:phosphatidate phosphatase PAH1
VRILVDGDGSFADLFVEVAPKDRAVFFSDVDGTLTLYESEEFTALVDGRLPSVHPDAPEVLRRIASRGALPLYVTARPEWLTDRTRALLDENGFPPGIVVTHPSTKGAVRRAAASFKRDVFARIEGRGYVPTWAFGNQPSDVEAYATTKVPPARRIFYQLDDVGPGARRIESYSDLLADPSL